MIKKTSVFLFLLSAFWFFPCSSPVVFAAEEQPANYTVEEYFSLDNMALSFNGDTGGIEFSNPVSAIPADNLNENEEKDLAAEASFSLQNEVVTPDLSEMPLTDSLSVVSSDESQGFTIDESASSSDILLPLDIYAITVVNPVYDGVIKPVDIPSVSITDEECIVLLNQPFQAPSSEQPELFGYQASFFSSDITYHTDISSASSQLKKALINRESEIRIYFSSDSEINWASLCKSIYAGAVVHTGVPTEGDYLRYEYGGYNAKGSGPSKPEGASFYSYLFIYAPLYYTTAEQEAQMNSLVSAAIDSLEISGKSNYDKVHAVYNYLCSNVSYDYTHESDTSYTLKFTAYAALANKTAVCQGFSLAFYRLCLELGIDTRIIESKSMVHAWNIVFLDGYYYELDSTWDAGRTDYLYFLRGSDYWLANHKKSGYSTLGDQYNDSAFSSSYPLPAWDYHSCTPADPVGAKEPSYSEAGYTGDIYCSVCGKLLLPGESVPPLGYKFIDVLDQEKYYFDPVYWALENGITVGYGGPDLFSPDVPCTREQVLTFLWRLNGCPEPGVSSVFVDVPAGAWYEKPVMWAYNNGITTGLNDGTGRFGVGQSCTREQCVTFLWRSSGFPVPAGGSSFTDIRSDAYYYHAVLWAAENGISVGLNDGTGRFGVCQSCTRAMIVTFLYRYSHTIL